jgi:hypothetical protein
MQRLQYSVLDLQYLLTIAYDKKKITKAIVNKAAADCGKHGSGRRE